MDGMIFGVCNKEEAPFLFGGVDLSMEDEFMVVPKIVDDVLQTPAYVADEYVLEANFAGLTGAILR